MLFLVYFDQEFRMFFLHKNKICKNYNILAIDLSQKSLKSKDYITLTILIYDKINIQSLVKFVCKFVQSVWVQNYNRPSDSKII